MSDDPKSDLWAGLYWVPDGDGSVRAATPSECAECIAALRDQVRALREENKTLRKLLVDLGAGVVAAAIPSAATDPTP